VWNQEFQFLVEDPQVQVRLAAWGEGERERSWRKLGPAGWQGHWGETGPFPTQHSNTDCPLLRPPGQRSNVVFLCPAPVQVLEILVKDSHLTGRTDVGRASIQLADILAAQHGAVSEREPWLGRRVRPGLLGLMNLPLP
jgi:hypothetical protein